MADWCELVLCLVLGNIAGLLDDLQQPPGHGFHQGQHVYGVKMASTTD